MTITRLKTAVTRDDVPLTLDSCPELNSVRNTARMLGITEYSTRALIKREVLAGKKIGRLLFVLRSSIVEFVRTTR
jgi:hypothetical protein